MWEEGSTGLTVGQVVQGFRGFQEREQSWWLRIEGAALHEGIGESVV
jgi:hypothetical protein